MPKTPKKRKMVEGFAIVTKCSQSLCQWVDSLSCTPQRFNCYESEKTAKRHLKPYAHMKIYKIVPCTITFEITEKKKIRRTL